MASRSRRRWWIPAILALVVVIVAAATAVALLVDRKDGDPAAKDATPRPALETPHPTINPVVATAPIPTSAGLAQALRRQLANPDVGKLTGQIVDAMTGQVLWSKNPTVPEIPGSTTKLLTATATLLTFDPESRTTTTVLDGGDGTVIIKGVLDPTLAAEPAGKETYFTDPGRLPDLAKQIKAAGIPVRRVAVDLSATSGVDMAKSWDASEVPAGNIAPIQSLMIDSGRLDPLADYSPRTETPGLDGGKTLARLLGLDPADVTTETAPAGAKVVAKVQSAPLLTRLGDMLTTSDNVLAENMALLLAQHAGIASPSLADGYRAVLTVLRNKGFDVSAVRLGDSNGLSTDNHIPAEVLTTILSKATTSGSEYAVALRPLLGMLPVAAATGTLVDRFTDESAGGWIRAKTGTVSESNALAGIVQTKGGRVLVFALMSDGQSPLVARPALDDIASTLSGCGCGA